MHPVTIYQSEMWRRFDTLKKKRKKMLIDTSKEKVFFTSDTHFGHKNIIKYCNRPFKDVTEMNETLIRNWNAKVGPNDWVFHLGDFCFISERNKQSQLVDRLNGQIFFIQGNHDHDMDKTLFFNASHGSLYEVDFLINGEKKKFVLCHYAMRIWNKSHRGAIHLYGHSHGSLPDDKHALSIDVGTDCHNYTPISIEDVMAIMAKKEYKSIDHHGAE